MDFVGKTAVVTGAASGIGRATAVGFGKEGANVALLDVNADRAQEIAEQIDSSGGTTMVCPVDMTEPATVRDALHAAYARFGRIDALANVAGIYPSAPVLDVTEELWDRIESINTRGVFFCCQEAIRIMVAQGSGAIVNVASGSAFRPTPGLAAYCASKAGVVGFTRVLVMEFARTGVRINVVAPGLTKSETLVSTHGEERIDEMAAGLVTGRYVTPEENANAILWLCSDKASGVNGATIFVNAGNIMF